MSKIAMITGVTGQDGAHLSRLLLDKGYIVHGVKRRASSFNTQRLDDLYVDPHEGEPRFFLHYGDMTDSTNLIRLVQEIQPDEIFTNSKGARSGACPIANRGSTRLDVARSDGRLRRVTDIGAVDAPTQLQEPFGKGN